MRVHRRHILGRAMCGRFLADLKAVWSWTSVTCEHCLRRR